jgi:hypothetical protein
MLQAASSFGGERKAEIAGAGEAGALRAAFEFKAVADTKSLCRCGVLWGPLARFTSPEFTALNFQK